MTVYTGTGAGTTALIGGTSGVQTLGTVGRSGGRMRIVTDTYELLAAEATSTVWFARLPSNARISNLSRLSWDDCATIGSPTLDLGVFNPTGYAGFTDDPDGINDGLDLATATADKAVLKDFANGGKYLWQFCPTITADPKQMIDIKGTVMDASTNQTGTITWSIVYIID